MLQKIGFLPGFNKQVTATGGEGQWVGGDYVRFRYGTPEKIGGWAQLGDATLTGRNTALHHFVNAPSKVEVPAPKAVPPQSPKPQPAADSSSAGPIE